MGKINIIMFGPHPTATGGISNVINNWLEVGLSSKVNLEYISTLKRYVPRRYFYKFIEALYANVFLLFRSSSSVDIVHIHVSSGLSFFRKLILLKIAKLKGLKIIVHLHSSEFEQFYNESSGSIKNRIRSFFDDSDAIIVLSKSWKRFIEKISSNNSIFILYNGANLEKFSGKIPHNNRINISFMGRLGKRKGVYDLLEAFARVVKDFPNAHLVLGGDGDINEVKQIVSQKELSNNIHILGWVSGEEKVRVFQECDIYVLPSYNEGLPGSILEAMSVGIPVVSTRVGGIPEAVSENKNGFLIQPGDVDDMTDKLQCLVANDGLRQRMGIESMIIMQEKFDIVQIVEELVQIYQKVLIQ
jgi:glycosyltransferase involved in cell wall biosynthesis